MPADPLLAPVAPAPAHPVRHRISSLAVVVLLAGLAGGLTSIGQLLLPGLLAPLANSASGWTLVTVAVVAAVRAPVRAAAVLGAVAFAALTLGYTAISTLRGYPFDPSFWLLVGLVAGPLVGAATALLRSTDTRMAGSSAGVLSGILVGEGCYGLLVVAGTTGVAYWIGILTAGLVALPAAALCRRWPARTLGAAAAVLAATAAAFLLGYAVVLPALLIG